MNVSDYQFDDDEIAKLNDHRDNQPDVRLKVRFIALLMLAEGIELKSIASIIGKSIKTIENWHYQYVTKGIDSLNSFQYKPKQSYLTTAQIDQVVDWVKQTNPCKTKEVREYIKDHFKVLTLLRRGYGLFEEDTYMRSSQAGIDVLLQGCEHLKRRNCSEWQA